MGEAQALLRLVQMAPAREMGADDQGPTYVARFEEFPAAIEVVRHLIEQTWDLHDVHIVLDGRPIASRIGFYAAVRCYQESLGTPDTGLHCLERARQVAVTRGCPNHSCEPRCQFICAACVKLFRGENVSWAPSQFGELVRRTDVSWCPNLDMRGTRLDP